MFSKVLLFKNLSRGKPGEEFLTRVTQSTRGVGVLFTLFLGALWLSGCGRLPTPWDREPPSAAVRPAGDWPAPVANEPVLDPFQQAEVQAPAGPMTITSGSGVFRVYFWNGDGRAVYLQPREKTWYGARGLYHPGDFDHWEPHTGVTRAFIEEGTRDFATLDEALEWLENHRPQLVWRGDGLAAGWEIREAQRQIVINLWQIRIAGEKPAGLPNSLNSAIRIRPIPPFDPPPPSEL